MTLPGLGHEVALDDYANRSSFSASKVGRVIRALVSTDMSPDLIRQRWLQAVATRTSAARPDIASTLIDVIGVEPVGEDHLKGLTIGEVGVCYEALLALIDRDMRKSAGQYFTPDDAARFMASQSVEFGDGVWLDPCCGVGNLSWHLCSVQPDPGAFVRDRLSLIDKDEIALKSAVAILSADWADNDDHEAVQKLRARSIQRDFLGRSMLPEHDYVIVNPPYARTEANPDFRTSASKDLFAYFLEKVAISSKGFIAVTPASYLSVPKFQILRNVIDEKFAGGEVFVFDNVPDTLFRGYKFGSNNTSKTNFVRAAITVCSPRSANWLITPIIRWSANTRAIMFDECHRLLTPRRIGPHGEWVKITPGLEAVWDKLANSKDTLADLAVDRETIWALDVGLTPRYYISATRRNLDRSSKATLYFATETDRDRAAVVLNSSVPYFWWRALDGGVTLPRRVLMSTPIPQFELSRETVEALWVSEAMNVVVKQNSGRMNENVKHSTELVSQLNTLTMSGASHLKLLYASSMFPLSDMMSPSLDDGGGRNGNYAGKGIGQ
ncbi:N-6 DNA methylase [Gulosibacter macacae]|uniref:N-6 DNA methylase n=1 Tax=Gulosibacter macacae TaxID=2488791 RepID=UPI001639F38A|nr:N-6 DNA methylase [Gulosibacter macacae]